MQRIILEVDDELANAWRNGSSSLKQSYQNKITDLLREMKKKEFFELLDAAGETAEKNGLNEEVLNNLLNEKE